MSTTSSPRIAATMVPTFLVLLGVASAGRAQTTPAPAPGLEPGIESSIAQSAAPGPRLQAALPDRAAPAGTHARTTDVASPPSPLQTAGALAGALFAIALAIAGVTVTFRSMRDEMRRGRGRSRRPARSERTTLTPDLKNLHSP